MDAGIAVLGYDLDHDVGVIRFKVTDHFSQEQALRAIEGKGLPEGDGGHSGWQSLSRLWNRGGVGVLGRKRGLLRFALVQRERNGQAITAGQGTDQEDQQTAAAEDAASVPCLS